MLNRTQSSATERRDLFISHASEDKDDFVRPLADTLIKQGVTVWFDQSELRIGDSLRGKIDEGLRHSRFGLVVLSPAFFRKQWTQYEMDGLISRQNITGERIILPILHRLTKEEILQQSPSLNDIVSLNSSTHSVEEIAHEVTAVVRRQDASGNAQLPFIINPSAEQRRFGIFYVASEYMTEPQHREKLGSKETGRIAIFPGNKAEVWLSVVANDEELEYIIDENRIRVRLDWGNQWSGDEIYAQGLINGNQSLALTIRHTDGSQIYLPSVRNISPTPWRQGHSNRSGWITLEIPRRQ